MTNIILTATLVEKKSKHIIMENNIQTINKTFFLIKQQIQIDSPKNLYTLSLIDQQGNNVFTYFAQEKNKLIPGRILKKISNQNNTHKHNVILNFKITNQLQNSAQEYNLQLSNSFPTTSFLQELENTLMNNLLTAKNDQNELFSEWYKNQSIRRDFTLKNAMTDKFVRLQINLSSFEENDSTSIITEQVITDSELEQIYLDSEIINNNLESDRSFISKEEIFLLIQNAGLNNFENRNFKLEIARLRLIYIMTLFSNLNTIQILDLKKDDFKKHQLAYLIINENKELKRDFTYFFTIKNFLFESQKKSLNVRNSRAYWVSIMNEDFKFFQKQQSLSNNLTLKDLKSFYYQLIADYSPNIDYFQKITQCSQRIIRKYKIRIASNNSYEMQELQIYKNILENLGQI